MDSMQATFPANPDNSYLMVCLCDDGDADIPLGTMSVLLCSKHNAVILKSLGEVNTLLHVKDKDGNIVPVVRGE